MTTQQVGSKADTFESDWLKLIFNNTTVALLGDAAGVSGSAASGSLYVSLHTTTVSGNLIQALSGQSTEECAYTGYARQAVVRSTGGWTVSATAPTQVVNAAAIMFPTCSADTGLTSSYVGIGTDSTGSGKLLFFASLSPTVAMASGTAIQINAGALKVTED